MGDSENKRKLVLLLPWVGYKDVHLKKDTGLFPLYIAKKYAMQAEIVFTDSADSTQVASVAGLVSIQKFPNIHHYGEAPLWNRKPLRWLAFMHPYKDYIRKNRGSASRYMFFHASDNTLFLAWLVKKTNPSAKTWIKLDLNGKAAKGIQAEFLPQKKPHRKLHSWAYKKIMKGVDLLSCESRQTYEIIRSIPELADKIRLIPNGIDYDGRGQPSVREKEHVMLTVCRLGAPQKNMQVLLNALKLLRLGDWKLYFVGPQDDEGFDFQRAFAGHLAEHPEQRDSVISLGNIADKDRLWGLYAKSSVFLLPSKEESFAIAALEACMAGNYPVLSNFASARDFIRDESWGYILPESRESVQNEDVMVRALAKRMQQIIDGEVDLFANYTERLAYFTEYFTMQHIIEKSVFRDWLS